MVPLNTTEAWRAAHPDAVIGLLELSGIQNAQPSLPLNELKRSTEALLRQRFRGFSRRDFLALPVMAAYDRYYRRFDKTYHVLQQVESIVLKGKSLPDVSPLVDANFLAEVETFVLTAGHDTAKLQGPIVIDVSQPGDQITQLSGAAKAIRAGDMIMRDVHGVRCSILYGQDSQSSIAADTSAVLFVAYAPPGVPAEAVEAHLGQIEAYVRLFAPAAGVAQHRLLAGQNG